MSEECRYCGQCASCLTHEVCELEASVVLAQFKHKLEDARAENAKLRAKIERVWQAAFRNEHSDCDFYDEIARALSDEPEQA